MTINPQSPYGWFLWHPWLGAAFLAAVLLISVIVSWALDRHPPLEMLSGAANRQAYRHGETVEMKWDFIAHRRSCSGRVARWVTTQADPEWQAVLDSPSILPGQGIRPHASLPLHMTLRLSGFRIPNDMPIDQPNAKEPQAAYHVAIEWRCNPLHWLWPIRSVAPVIPFKVY